MSMSLHVYVGPFLKCYPRGSINDLYAVTGGKLHDLRGEVFNDADFDAIGPNVKLDGVSRETTWEKNGEPDEIAEPDVESEVSAFGYELCDEIAALRTQYERVELTWGVVPGWF